MTSFSFTITVQVILTYETVSVFCHPLPPGCTCVANQLNICSRHRVFLQEGVQPHCRTSIEGTTHARHRNRAAAAKRNWPPVVMFARKTATFQARRPIAALVGTSNSRGAIFDEALNHVLNAAELFLQRMHLHGCASTRWRVLKFPAFIER